VRVLEVNMAKTRNERWTHFAEEVAPVEPRVVAADAGRGLAPLLGELCAVLWRLVLGGRVLLGGSGCGWVGGAGVLLVRGRDR